MLGRATSVGEITLQGLGSFGDSFGVVTAFFSGVAVVLVYLTYDTQKAELNHLREHLSLEQRRQRASQFLSRMELKFQEATSGNRSGRDLIHWMHGELDHVFFMEVTIGGNAERRWRAVLDGGTPLPDVEPLTPVVYSFLGLARVFSEAAQPEEATELADLTKSAITSEAFVPLLYATAVTLRGRIEELNLASNLFAAIGIKPLISNSFELSQVPGCIPQAIDDTLT